MTPHNSNIVIPFDPSPYEWAVTMEGSLRFLFSDGSLRFDVEVKSCGFHEDCDLL